MVENNTKMQLKLIQFFQTLQWVPLVLKVFRCPKVWCMYWEDFKLCNDVQCVVYDYISYYKSWRIYLYHSMEYCTLWCCHIFYFSTFKWLNYRIDLTCNAMLWYKCDYHIIADNWLLQINDTVSDSLQSVPKM